MKIGRISLGFAALAITACSNTAPTGVMGSTRPSVGTFKAEAQEKFSADVGDGHFEMVTTKEYLTIGGDSVTLRRTCRVGDATTVVEASALAEVNATHFVLAQPLEKMVRIGQFKCGIKLAAGVWGYQVEDAGLTLTSTDESSKFYGYKMGQRPSMLQSLANRGAAVGRFVRDAFSNNDDDINKP